MNDAAIPPAGHSVRNWCRAAGFSKATLYTLPFELQPVSVKIGKRRIVIEQPADYLRRIAETRAAELREIRP
jgi:hypothetical protein